jgi:peroxiredoxin
MATRAQKEQRRDQRERTSAELAARERRARALRRGAIVGVLVAIAALGAVYAFATGGKHPTAPDGNGTAGRYAYAVGDPGPGAPAPTLDLRSTRGGSFNLSRQRGKTTLVYFQEGVGCQPCWDQIRDLERQWPKLKALGIDQMVSVTGNTLGQLRTKAGDEGLRTPVLADPGLAQSRAWSADRYGMMGGSADGHSFVVVDPRGTIRFRADYGGAPNYTMYVPVPDLAADLKRGLARTAHA